MLDRVAVGELPEKHHVVSRGPDGALRHEECLTREGFAGAYTLMYHERRPHPSERSAAAHGWRAPVAADGDRHLARTHLLSGRVEAGGAQVDGRRVLLFNEDLAVGVARPTEEDPVYVVHGEADQLVYVHEGAGVLRTPLGDLRFGEMDYVAVPKGMIHRFVPDEGVAQHWLTMECRSGLGLLDQWRNEVGQLRMDAPYCHRDFRSVVFRGPIEEGIRDVVVLREGRWHGFRLRHSPLDVVGWDGTVYPWVFPILKFQPRAGLVHLPPDWHGTFKCRGALICSFVPRVVDFHPEAIPCPYPHSSVDCDEILFYARGNFTSRRGVGPGSISLHPAGVPHGPHPGAYEASLGVRTTDELAVMIDTFRPLRLTATALEVEDGGYHESFDGAAP